MDWFLEIYLLYFWFGGSDLKNDVEPKPWIEIWNLSFLKILFWGSTVGQKTTSSRAWIDFWIFSILLLCLGDHCWPKNTIWTWTMDRFLDLSFLSLYLWGSGLKKIWTGRMDQQILSVLQKSTRVKRNGSGWIKCELGKKCMIASAKTPLQREHGQRIDPDIPKWKQDNSKKPVVENDVDSGRSSITSILKKHDSLKRMVSSALKKNKNDGKSLHEFRRYREFDIKREGVWNMKSRFLYFNSKKTNATFGDELVWRGKIQNTMLNDTWKCRELENL